MLILRFREQNMFIASFFACFSLSIICSGSGVSFFNSSSIFFSCFLGVFSIMSEISSTYARICKKYWKHTVYNATKWLINYLTLAIE